MFFNDKSFTSRLKLQLGKGINLGRLPLSLKERKKRYGMEKHSSLSAQHVSEEGKNIKTLTPGANVIKLFTAVSYEFS